MFSDEFVKSFQEACRRQVENVLGDFDEEDTMSIHEHDENIPLANQNFSSMSGQVKSVSDEQEFCAVCKKPVKPEWKACPFCGEFLEEYED